MSLQLILGNSGSGKTHYLYTDIIDQAINNPMLNYFVIVPEQFTMQTQKDLVSLHPDKGIINIDVLSFLRLAERVFSETGKNNKIVLKDTGKNMILRRVVEEEKDNLKLFSSNVKKQGFISELKSMISELYQYRINTQSLDEIITLTKKKPMLESKLKDLLTVYEGFGKFINENYIASEEILEILSDIFAQNQEILKDCIICLDGFTGFTPSQYQLVKMLLKYSKQLIVTVTIDTKENTTKLGQPYELFYLSKKTIHNLRAIAAKENIDILDDVKISRDVPYRFRESEALCALEKRIFRYPVEPFLKEQEDICIAQAVDSDEEVSFVLKEIRKLISEKGYKYGDIAIVAGDISVYESIISNQFDKEEIPYFMDCKKDIMNQPLVQCICSILETIENNYSYETMFRLLKSKIVPIEREDIELIENYVIQFGIRGHKAWNREWKKIQRKGETNLEKINDIRARIFDLLEPVYKVFKEKDQTVTNFTKSLYMFIVCINAQQTMNMYVKKFEEEQNKAKAKEFSGVYKLVIELLDQMVELLGNEKMTVKEYLQVITSGLEEAKVGLVPPRIDQIVIGDIERTRLKDIKALFFIGVNDGMVPKSHVSGGLISDQERQFLASFDVELAASSREKTYTEQFYLYLNLTKPQNQLYVTYSTVGRDGKALRPSYLVGKLKTMFPKQKVLLIQDGKEDLAQILAVSRGMTYVRDGIRDYLGEEMPDIWKELYCWYLKDIEYKEDIFKMIEGAFYTQGQDPLSKAVAKILYGNELTNSVTRLEKYAACAFAHYVRYGLQLEQRKEYVIDVPDLGNLFHRTIDLFSNKMDENKFNWGEISWIDRERLVKESIEEVAVEYENTAINSSSRNAYILNRVHRIVNRTVWAVCEQIKKGKFTPSQFELKFSHLDQINAVTIPLSDTEHIRLQGRIDRIDTYEEDNSIYVNVIDYKSGNQSFDIVSFYHGLQLQLIVYLKAAMELTEKKYPDKAVVPAGIFYYHMDDPLVEKILNGSEEEKNEKILELVLKELKLNGMVNDNAKIAGMFDKALVEGDNLKPSTKSDVVPIEVTKDGSLGKRSNVLNEKQFKQIQSYAYKKIKEFGKEIIDGNAAINPYKLGDKTACTYCDYSSICGFDQQIEGMEYRNLKKYDKDEIFALWEEDMEDLS